MFETFYNIFPSLRERNFRLYFYGQIVSLAGTYLQSTAQGWLVLQITHSAFWVGFVSSLVFFPTFLLVLFGGAIVDRFDRRKLLYITQTAAMLLAFALGILVLTNRATLLEIIILAFLLGVVNAVDTPARSAFIPDMVENRENLSSAISLNTGMVTTAQAIGPALGGILIAVIGVGGTFIINGLTFIAVLVALYAMSTIPRQKIKADPHPIAMIKAGFKYLFSINGLVFLFIFSFLVSIVGRSYAAIFPVVATEFYRGDSRTLGWLLSAFGIGAAVGGIFLSKYIHAFSSKFFVLACTFLSSVALIIFPLFGMLVWGAICIGFAGFGFAVALTTVITILQHISSSEMRGRVLSIFYFIFFGGYAIGNFSIGWFAARFGSARMISVSGILLLVILTVFFPLRNKILEIG